MKGSSGKASTEFTDFFLLVHLPLLLILRNNALHRPGTNSSQGTVGNSAGHDLLPTPGRVKPLAQGVEHRSINHPGPSGLSSDKHKVALAGEYHFQLHSLWSRFITTRVSLASVGPTECVQVDRQQGLLCQRSHPRI